MSEKCPFCGAEEMEPWMGKYRTWTCHTQMGMNGDIDRHRDCYEAELSQLRGLLEEAVELLNGYEQIRQNVMGAVSLAVAHGITWPQDQIDLAMKTIAGREAFLAKAKMKEG